MNQYVTGTIIKKLREENDLTQAELAGKLSVSDKTVSKWETGRGLPDITLLQPLAKALNVSLSELISGSTVKNSNISANMLKTKFYVCPVCGNVIVGTGEAVHVCHGIELNPLEMEEPDQTHEVSVEPVEDEYFVTVDHDMTRQHYISFMAAVSTDRVQLVKLYPEGNAETRFKRSMVRFIYYYCNRDGLFYIDLRKNVRANKSLNQTKQ